MQAPRVTVAVPLHNGVAYLEQAIASLGAQTFEAWEAVLVDDASTDGTHALALELAAQDPERIRVLRLPRNVGVAAARAAAIDAAQPAELIALLDQDDVLEPHYLERCVGLYDEHRRGRRNIGIVACNARLLEASGIAEQTFAERYGWTDPIDYDDMIQRNCICARALFSRAAYERAGGFAPETQPSDDYDLWLRMPRSRLSGRRRRASRSSIYRLHAGATSRDVGRMAETILLVHERALAPRRGHAAPAPRAARAHAPPPRAARARACARSARRRAGRWSRPRAAVRAAPYGVVAFLQRPSRWPEWARDVARRRRGPSAGVVA